MRLSVLKESMELSVRRKWQSREILFLRYKFNNLILFSCFLFEANDLYLGIICYKQGLLAKTNVSVGVIFENILNLCAGDLSIFELNDKEPPGIVFSLIKFEDKVLKEYVPADNIIYECVYI